MTKTIAGPVMTGVTINLPWYEQPSTPIWDGNNINSARPTFTIYSDADYPPVPTVEPSIANQRFVGGVGASDANDGTQGSPWATFEKAITEMCGQSTWYCLNLSSNLTVSSSFTTRLMGAGPGTISQFAYIRQDPNASPVTLTMDKTVEIDGQSHWLWYGFNIQLNSDAIESKGFWFGQNAAMSRQCIRNMTGTMSGLGGDNIGFFYTENGNLDYFGAFNNNFTGPGVAGVSGNTSCLLTFRTKNLRWENNVVTNAPRPLYFKHANQAANGAADVHIRYNHHKLTNAGESCFFAGRGNGGTYEIIDNIFDARPELSNGGGGEQVDDIAFRHNTVKGQLFANYFDGGNPVRSSLLRDNIFTDRLYLQEFLQAQPNNNITNYNYYGNGLSYLNVDYTLAEWQAASVPAGQDVNSIAGTADFVGGASPTTVAGYQLNTGDPGIGAASDGADMGADTTKVGNK